MKATTRRTISMARRVLDFATTHPLADAGYNTVVASLKAEVAKADDLGRLQGDGARREHAEIAIRDELRRTMRSQLLRRLATIADLNATDHPELVGKYDLPDGRGPNRAFVLQAQSILASAIEQKDLLAQLGLGDTFIADLTNAVNRYDVATADAHVARNDHVGARGAFKALGIRCNSEVTIIGTFVEATYANDAQTLAAWESASNLAGPFARSKEAPAAPPEPAPAPIPAPPPAPTDRGDVK